MLEISDLELDAWQTTEVEEADPALVASWLEAASAPEIYSPTGFFLTGLRSGRPHYAGPSREQAQHLHLALRWIQQTGIFYVTEEAVLAELFDRNGLLEHQAEDELLRERMAQLWRKHRPDAEAVEAAQRERASRNAATYFLLREVKKDEPESGEAAAGT